MSSTFRSLYIRMAACLALSALLLASCATSSGSAYDRSVSGDGSAAAMAAQAKQDDDDNSSWDDDDDDDSGWSWDGDSSSSTTIVIDLTPRGTLTIQGAPSGSSVFVNGSYVGAVYDFGPVAWTLSSGWSQVRVECFGYDTWTGAVEIPAYGGVEVNAYLPPLPFGLEGNDAPLRFDPKRPGALARASSLFRATAPGRAEARVVDMAGHTVRDLGELSVDGPAIRVVWDGRDDQGALVSGGPYLIVLDGRGQDGTWASASAAVEIADLPPVTASTLHGGFSGALLAADASALPEGFFQLSAGAYAFPSSAAGGVQARIPAWLGFRLGLPWLGAAELVASAMYVSYPGYELAYDPSSISLAASLKGVMAGSGDLKSAILVRAAVASFVDEASSGWPPSWDGPARFPGAGLGLVLEYAPGAGRVFLNAGVDASTFYPGWDDGVWPVPGIYSWASLRLGAEGTVQLGAAGQLTLAASAAARTEPFGAAFGLRPPLSLAGEAAWYPAGSPFVIHAMMAGEWDNFTSWYLAGGLGLSIMM
ncbi:MAG: PEGA domain-containing protein [Spirochaetia bacterium]|nr:PEGA domain-containing protein [Spirochaetia bacterium]